MFIWKMIVKMEKVRARERQSLIHAREITTDTEYTHTVTHAEVPASEG